MEPVRIQRKRTKGFDLQAESLSRNGLPCVYVGRPSRWGNPWTLENVSVLGPNGKGGVRVVRPPTREDCIEGYRDDLLDGSIGVTVNDIKAELRGKNLACWCAENVACHADVLLEIANG